MSREHLAVCRYLIPRFENDQIVKHQLVGRYGPFPVIPDHDRFRLRHDGQFIDRFLRPDLLYDADHGIADNDAHEHGVFIRSDQEDQNKKRYIQEVEKGQSVAKDDLLIAARNGLFVRIDLPLLHSFLYFSIG